MSFCFLSLFINADQTAYQIFRTITAAEGEGLDPVKPIVLFVLFFFLILFFVCMRFLLIKYMMFLFPF